MSSTRSVPAPPAPPNTRETRALTLYRERADEIERIAPDVYLVPACSARGGFYKVDYEAERCTCPDAEFHPEASCKHVLCVGILRAKHRRAPDYVRILEDARRHPERTYSEHIAAAQEIAAESYRRDLARISPAAWDAYHRDLEAEADELQGV